MSAAPRNSRVARAALGCALGFAVLAPAACRRGEAPADAADTTQAARIAAQVRARYGGDAVAAGAWTWSSGRATWVLVDVQSATPGLVQARAELWAGDAEGIVRFGQSDVMAAAGEIGAFLFEDATGDSIPDLLGWVADSAGVQYPVFIPGAQGSMTDELEDAARGWRFDITEEYMPRFLRGLSTICAIQLWAEEPAPDSAPAGWRSLPIQRGAPLGAPALTPPACP